MAASLLWSPYSESSALSSVQLESAQNEESKLGRLRRGSAWGFCFSSDGPSTCGSCVIPCFMLGDASGEGGTFLVSLSLFSPLFFFFFFFRFFFSSFPPLFPCLPLFPSSFLSLEVFFFFLRNCLYCLFPRCKE